MGAEERLLRRLWCSHRLADLTALDHPGATWGLGVGIAVPRAQHHADRPGSCGAVEPRGALPPHACAHTTAAPLALRMKCITRGPATPSSALGAPHRRATCTPPCHKEPPACSLAPALAPLDRHEAPLPLLRHECSHFPLACSCLGTRRPAPPGGRTCGKASHHVRRALNHISVLRSAPCIPRPAFCAMRSAVLLSFTS